MNSFKNAFKYPFSFVNNSDDCNNTLENDDPNCDDRYSLKNIIVMMFNKELKKEKMNIKKFYFPKNIEEVYWFQKGIQDVKPWMFIGKVSYKNKFKYVFYEANADYTGFDCQGDMTLYVSKSLNRLIKKAIPKDIINKKLKNILKKVLHP
jgi:hypothetical protein